MRKRRKALLRWAVLVILLTLVFGFGTFGRAVLLIAIVLCGARALHAAFELVAGKIDERRQDRLRAERDRKAIAERREQSLKPEQRAGRGDGGSIMDDASPRRLSAGEADGCR